MKDSERQRKTLELDTYHGEMSLLFKMLATLVALVLVMHE